MTIAELTDPPVTSPPPARRRRLSRLFPKSGVLVWLCAAWIIMICVLAITASWLPIDDPAAVSSDPNMRPGVQWAEPLGTDALGRSLLSRSIVGARASLTVALIATAIAMLAGLLFGLVVGYLGPIAGAVFDIITSVMLAFPPLVLLIGIAAVLRPSLTTVVLSLGIIGIPLFARVSRASTMTLMNREFISAARVMGASPWRIIGRELLPNVVLPVLAVSMVISASFIVAEGSISFLGLGIPPPTPSWGGMIADGRDQLARHPHAVFVPAAFFFLTVYALNVVGEAIQQAIGGKESAL